MSVDIQTSLTRLMPATGQTDNLTDLKPGQQLTVKVISRLAEKNTFIVSHAGTAIAARANRAIQAGIGQPLKLQVLQVQPAVILKILDAPVDAQTGNTRPPALLQFNVPTASAKPAQLPVWTMGQQISATIIHVDDQKMRLQIDVRSPTVNNGNVPANSASSTGQLLHTAASTTALPNSSKTVITLPPATGQGETYKTGQQVRLQVLQTGPEPAFRILPQARQAQETITAALRQLLPRQTAPTVLLEQMLQHVSQRTKAQQLPETLQRLARIILAQLPTSKQLQSGSTLKQAVQDSGLFLEAKLAQGRSGTTLQQDFKGNLLKFLQAMQRASPVAEARQQLSAKALLPEELPQKGEGTLAKLVLDQLSSLPREDSSRQAWNLELPYIDQEEARSVHIAIEREKQTGQHSEEEANWSVTISIAPPRLGTIHCRLSFCDNTLNTQFWSDRTKTTQLIGDNLDYLQQQIEAAGLKTGLMRVNQGLPEPQRKSGQENRRLFDGKA